MQKRLAKIANQGSCKPAQLLTKGTGQLPAKIIAIARSEDGAHEVISQWTGTGQMARYGHLRGLVSDRPWSRWIGLGFVERLLQNVNSSPAHCIHFKSGV